jgi:RHS repeat-associated protein
MGRSASAKTRIGLVVVLTIFASVAALASAAQRSSPAPSAAVSEIKGLRTQSSRTYDVNGDRVARVYPTAVNYRTRSGEWEPINNKLKPISGGGFENSANSYDARLPGDLSQPVRFSAGKRWVSFVLRRATGRASASGATASFLDALPQTDVLFTATGSGLKEAIKLKGPGAPRSFRYRVRASRGLTAKTNRRGAVVFRTRSGRTVFAFAAPFMYDSTHSSRGVSSRVSARLRRSVGGWKLTLAPSRKWLSSPKRLYPVVIDPTVNYVTHYETRGYPYNTVAVFYGADQDCYITGGASANTRFCGGQTLKVGYDGTAASRALLRFDVQNAIPKNTKIVAATLAMPIASAGPATQNLTVLRVSKPWTSAATWNTYDGVNAWSTPGGDTAATLTTTSISPGWKELWAPNFPALTVQRWIDGVFPNYGILVKDSTETANNVYTFHSTLTSDPTKLPYLHVHYEPPTGALPYYRFESQDLDDRTNLAVNVASGNLLVTGNDVQIPGTGLDLNLSRYYNSQLEHQTDLGLMWTFNAGVDIALRYAADGSGLFHGPSGYRTTFPKNASAPTGFDSPAGLNATLTKNADGTSVIRFNRTGAKFFFNANSIGSLNRIEDQSGNKITYGYDAANHLSTIEDTQSTATAPRKLNITSDTSGRITQVSDWTGRIWKYTYNGEQLASYTDPNNKTTTYSYPGGDEELETITDSLGHTTKITYDSSFMERVTSVTRLATPTSSTGNKTTFQYGFGNDGLGKSCVKNGTSYRKTVVTDPVGNTTTDPTDHQTTYCYDDQNRVVLTYDGRGNKRDTSYTSQSEVQTYAPPSNGTLGVNASFAYDSSSNSLTKVTQPAERLADGTTRDLSTNLAYATPEDQAHEFRKYYPASVTNPQGQTTSFGYNDQGNVTSVSDSVSGTSIGRDSRGNVTSVTDGNNNPTIYTYDANKANLITITPPGPLGKTDITYDGLSRIATVRDGLGQLRTYTYDPLDRITKILFSDGSSVNYTYDAAGNTLTRKDQTASTSNTTTYTYDPFNHLATEDFPGTGRNPDNDYDYDATGNLISLEDAGGNVTYGYDSANLLTSLTDPQGVRTTFDYDEDGQRKLTTYPNGDKLNNSYDLAGRAKNLNAQGPTGATLKGFDYTYKTRIDPSTGKTVATQLLDSVKSENGDTTSYGYDSRDRLTDATTKNNLNVTTDSRQFTYDKPGNMTTKTVNGTVTTFAYDAANELCWSYGGSAATPTCGSPPAGATTWTVDKNGNLRTNSNGLDLAYNAKDQTTSIKADSISSAQAATYRGPNQIERITEGPVIFENNALGIGTRKATSTAAPIYFTRDERGTLVGARPSGGSKYYYMFDALGSVVGLFNSSGVLVRSYKYDPYGVIISNTDLTGNGTAPVDQFRFTSGYNGAAGLYHFNMRYYLPSIGRWTQQDPISNGASLRTGNRYLYVADNPINNADPSGLDLTVGFGVGKLGFEVGIDNEGFPLHGGAGLGVGAGIPAYITSEERGGGLSAGAGVQACGGVYCTSKSVGFGKQYPQGIGTQSSQGWGLGLEAGVGFGFGF